MIREQDLLDAIAECQGEKNPNANTCIKLAAYYTILDNMRMSYSRSEGPTEQVRYNSGSEFSKVIREKDISHVLGVIDELMDTVAVLIPKLYRATIDRLNNI